MGLLDLDVNKVRDWRLQASGAFPWWKGHREKSREEGDMSGVSPHIYKGLQSMWKSVQGT